MHTDPPACTQHTHSYPGLISSVTALIVTDYWQQHQAQLIGLATNAVTQALPELTGGVEFDVKTDAGKDVLYLKRPKMTAEVAAALHAFKLECGLPSFHSSIGGA